MQRIYSNPAAAFLICTAFVIVGTIEFLRLPVALYPLTSKPTVWVWGSSKGISPEDFLEKYGQTMERSLRNTKGVEKITARYGAGWNEYQVTFTWNIDQEEAESKVRTAIDPTTSLYPGDWDKPWVGSRGGDSARVIVSAYSDKYSPEELTEILDSSLMPAVEALEGVDSAFMTRFDQMYVKIELDPSSLLQHGVAPADVLQSLRNSGYDQSLGTVGRMEVRSIIRPQDFTLLRDLKISDRVKLGSIAKVSLEPIVPENFFKANGKRALIIGANPKQTANIKAVCDSFLATVTAQVQQIDPAIKVDILLNPSKFIRSAINNVISAIGFGILISTLITFLFFGKIRSTAIICISIPLSLVGGFVLMDFFGIELNLISLGAMALATGMVVDGATVMLENIVRHLEERPPANARERLERVIQGAKEVWQPLLASLATTIIVFAPLPFTSPLTSAILGDLAIVMVCVMVISIFITFVIIPTFIQAFGVGSVHGRGGIYKIAQGFAHAFEWTNRLYTRILATILVHSSLAATVTLLSLLGVGVSVWVMATQLRQEIIAVPDSDKLFLFVDFNGERYELDEAEAMLAKHESRLLEKFSNEFSHTLSQINKNNGWIMAFMRDESKAQATKKALEEEFKNTPLVSFYIDTWNPTSLEIPDPPAIEFLVNASTDSERRVILENISEAIRDHEMVGRTEIVPNPRKENQLQLTVDQEKVDAIVASGVAITRDQILQTVGLALQEQHLFDMKVAEKISPVRIRFPEKMIVGPDDLSNIQVRVGSRIVPLKALVSLQRVDQYVDLYSENGKSVAKVQLWPKDTFKTEREKVRAEILGVLRANNKIDMSRLNFLNADIEIQQNIQSLLLALGAAVLLIAMILTLQFGSIINTLIILAAIPLGTIGAAFALWAAGSTLSLNSLLGFILLSGTAVNNSIMLLDRYVVARQSHDSVTAILEAARLRYRPIMVTALTTILGMLPIAFAYGEGGRILQPLGITVSAGLWISTLLTLFVVPILVVYSERLAPKAALSRATISAVATTGVLLLVMVSSTVVSSTSRAADLTLKEVELLAVSKSEKVKIAELAIKSAAYAKRADLAGVLPQMTLSRRYSEQNLRQDSVNYRGKYGVNTLTIEESITNPFSVYKSQAGLQTGVAFAETTAQITKADTIASIRRAWFMLQYLTAQAKSATIAVELAKADVTAAEKRYSGGFISKFDLDRSQVALLEAETTVADRTAQRATATAELQKLLQEENGATFVEEWPTQFAYFDKPEADLRAPLGNKTLKERRAELARELAQHAAGKAKAELLPDITVGANFSRVDPNLEPIERLGPEYFAEARWVLSAGKGYYAQRQASIQQQMRALEEAELIRDTQNGLSTVVSNLITAKRQFAARKTAAQSFKGIYESTRQRFTSGLVSSKAVTDDYYLYLQADARQIEAVQAVIDAIIRYSEVADQPELFYTLY